MLQETVSRVFDSVIIRLILPTSVFFQLYQNKTLHGLLQIWQQTLSHWTHSLLSCCIVLKAFSYLHGLNRLSFIVHRLSCHMMYQFNSNCFQIVFVLIMPSSDLVTDYLAKYVKPNCVPDAKLQLEQLWVLSVFRLNEKYHSEDIIRKFVAEIFFYNLKFRHCLLSALIYSPLFFMGYK